MYEQIYALAGPTQTYRITGDPLILEDIDNTITLFERFYYDPEKGGYFSHLDPITFDPRDALGPNRARKNWNSVGDHAPAYLINTLPGDRRGPVHGHAGVHRRHDRGALPGRRQQPVRPGALPRGLEPRRAPWGWQQNRAVVGHNLKIAWNLMRIHHCARNSST